MTVSAEDPQRPYMIVPLEQLDAVKALLRDGGINFWVDSESISINGGPEIIFINLGRGTDAAEVQRMLDQVE